MAAEGQRRGRFIVLDGIDGCGKTTQAERLANELSKASEVLHLREPGSTALGESLRALLLGREMSLTPEVETLLFTAARRQMLEERVAPALASGAHVVCERFHPSTVAYQGARSMNVCHDGYPEAVSPPRFGCGSKTTDVTLDIPPKDLISVFCIGLEIPQIDTATDALIHLQLVLVNAALSVAKDPLFRVVVGPSPTDADAFMRTGGHEHNRTK